MSVGRRAVAGALAAALFAAACSSSDAADERGEAGEASTDAVVGSSPEAAPTTAAPSTVATTATTTTIAGPVVADELGVIEVSARLIDVDEGEERLLAIVADGALADVPLPDGGTDRTDVAGWCAAAADGSGAGDLLVRVAPPAVDHAEGGLERFELIGSDPDADAIEPGAVRFDVAGESYESTDAEVVVADDAATGTFRAELADGRVIEGAFRCE